MNKFIKEQLDNLKVAKCEYSDDSTEIFIPKKIKNMEANLNEIKLFKTYLIEFADYILNELYYTHNAFHINPNYIFTYSVLREDCFSIYDIEGMADNIPQNQDLLTWIPK